MTAQLVIERSCHLLQILFAAWSCEISWLLIRDRLDLQALTPCPGQGSVSLISLTQTDTRHATTFLLALSVWREQLLLSLNPKPLGTQQLVRQDKISLQSFNYFHWRVGGSNSLQCTDPGLCVSAVPSLPGWCLGKNPPGEEQWEDGKKIQGLGPRLHT